MPVRRKEDVAQLDVTVNDSLGVDVVEGGREFREPPEYELLVKVGDTVVASETVIARI